ncbi:MAG: hypothetical protein VZQ80_00730 [Lachnospiraceae bacterium]|nr:hypothetical protein [Lachnospiraceae bacterium]
MKKNVLSWKDCYKLIRYCPQWKNVWIMCLCFLGFGIFMDIAWKGRFWPGPLMLSIIPAMSVSLLPPMATPGLAASSRKAQDIFTKTYPILYGLTDLLGMTIIIATRFVWLALGVEEEEIAYCLLCVSFYNILCGIYVPIFYKHPVIAYIILFAVCGTSGYFLGYNTGESLALNAIQVPFAFSLGGAIVIALLSSIAAALLMAALSYAMRKRPVPDMAIKTYMK